MSGRHSLSRLSGQTMVDSLTRTPAYAGDARAIAALGELPEHSPYRVLVVDDEESVRTALSRYLEGRGYQVAVADSGKAALALLEKQQYIVMLCDVRMSEMSGLDVVPCALHLDGDLAIIMLTAVNDAGESQRSAEVQMVVP